jgi:hypothetical protein
MIRCQLRSRSTLRCSTSFAVYAVHRNMQLTLGQLFTRLTAGNGSQFGWAVVSASSSASAAAAAAAVQHNTVVTVSQEASLDELVQPLTAEEAEVSTYGAFAGNKIAMVC